MRECSASPYVSNGVGGSLTALLLLRCHISDTSEVENSYDVPAIQTSTAGWEKKTADQM